MSHRAPTSAAPETGRFCVSDLPGWPGDDIGAALKAYTLNPGVQVPDTDARAFFEAGFYASRPIKAHVTGYFTPELDASLTRTGTFSTPLHRLPPGGCDLPRAKMDAALGDHVFAWLRDPVDRFFLQVQGSGVLRLPDGSRLSVGFEGRNGRPYTSIGKLLIQRGAVGADLTADRLADWLRTNPAEGRAVMNENESYVFFAPTDEPPTGTLGCPVTAAHSIAVDPDHLPLGTPAWLEVGGRGRLVVAQDTGSAIKGAGRVDLYFGVGADAGRDAGRLNTTGRLTPLVHQ